MGPKLPQMQNLEGDFVAFFLLRGQNRNFEKVRGLKLILSQIIYILLWKQVKSKSFQHESGFSKLLTQSFLKKKKNTDEIWLVQNKIEGIFWYKGLSFLLLVSRAAYHLFDKWN